MKNHLKWNLHIWIAIGGILVGIEIKVIAKHSIPLSNGEIANPPQPGTDQVNYQFSFFSPPYI